VTGLDPHDLDRFVQARTVAGAARTVAGAARTVAGARTHC